MENEQEISASNNHQKTKQKWKTSADALRKNDKTKNRSETSIIFIGKFQLLFRKTSKGKLSLSKIDEEISTNREIEKVDENDQQPNKEKFVKVTRKLMKMTVR